MNNQNNNKIYINERVSIPESELTVRFTPSSGPGGQHANKASTRVILSFDVINSPTLIGSLSMTQHQRLLEKLSTRLDGEGVLQIAVQDSRSQHQNRQIAIERLKEILAKGLQKPKRRIKTRPSAAARERRIQNKKQRGEKKRERGRDWLKDR